MLETLLDILKYTIPGVVVLVAVVLIVNKFLVKETDMKRMSIFAQQSDTALRLRLQAYERLILCVERMHPRSLISRLYQQDLTAQDLQLQMIQTIRAELEYNMSQQLYVSYEVWQTIRAVAEQEITMINRVGASCAMGDTASTLVRKITEHILTADETTMPTDIALEALNREAKFALFPPQA